jgi:hypothetical protein
MTSEAARKAAARLDAATSSGLASARLAGCESITLTPERRSQ